VKSGADNEACNQHRIVWVQLKHDAQIKIDAAVLASESDPKKRKYGAASAIDVDDVVTEEVIKTGAKETQQDALLIAKNRREKCAAEGTNWKVTPVKPRDSFDKITTLFEQHFENERIQATRVTVAADHAQQMNTIQMLEHLTAMRTSAVTKHDYDFYDNQIMISQVQFNRMNSAFAGAGSARYAAGPGSGADTGGDLGLGGGGGVDSTGAGDGRFGRSGE